MIKNQRSFVSKNSNSLNDMIKKTSMTFTNNNLRKIAAITTAIVMLSATGTIGFSPIEDAFAKKPDGTGGTQDVVSWSNGFPSGPHWNLNIHGKNIKTNVVEQPGCDNGPDATTEGFGRSVFVPINTTQAKDLYDGTNGYPDLGEVIGDINFVSNKRSDVSELTVLDPCGAPFGNWTDGTVDEVLVQYPKDAEAQVYMRILGQGVGKPHQDVSVATYPVLKDACDFLPAFEDGSVVQSFDIDCVNCNNDDSDNTDNTLLSLFANGTEMFEDSFVTDSAFSISETIYNDTDTSGNVTAGDIRLANANNTSWTFTDGSIVADTDPDEDPSQSLFNFTSFVMYNDADSSGNFTVGETVYSDTDADGYITAGDVRLANAITQGVATDEGGNLLECTDSSLIGLGLTTGQDAYVLGNETHPVTLERLNDDGAIDGKGQGNKKGKSLAMDVTGMFQWTGAICDTQIDYNLDGAISPEDFDIEIDDGDGIIEFNGTDSDGILNATDIDRLLSAGLLPTTNSTSELMEAADVDGDGIIEIDNNSGGTIEGESVDEFLLFIGALDDDVCRAYDQEWIFNIADIVIHGLEYENKGSNLVQLRFYPTDTTNFEE
jgi:hypothetical protein